MVSLIRRLRGTFQESRLAAATACWLELFDEQSFRRPASGDMHLTHSMLDGKYERRCQENLPQSTSLWMHSLSLCRTDDAMERDDDEWPSRKRPSLSIE